MISMVRDICKSFIYVSQPETEVNSATVCFVLHVNNNNMLVWKERKTHLMNNGRKYNWESVSKSIVETGSIP